MNPFPFHVIIPARFDSRRLPGKSLQKINARPLIQWVYDAALTSEADSVTVATDDQRIYDAVTAFGGSACMTSRSHESGTDRIAEAASALGLTGDAVIVNVQGDEPQIPGRLINQVVDCLRDHPEAVMATACEKMEHGSQMDRPSVVKVVVDHNGYALYFSRAPIPYDQKAHHRPGFRHVGIYAYRMSTLQWYTQLPACELERIERLEQLRVLWQGGKIAVCEAVTGSGPGIDTPEDLENFRRRCQT